MASDEIRTAVIQLSTEKDITLGSANLRTWSNHSAFKKGLKWCLSCWGVAICSVVIPIFHFVSVPLGLLCGPPIGFIIYKLHNGTTDVESGTGLCPNCRETVSLKSSAAVWPLKIECSHCCASILVSLEEPSSGLPKL